MNANNGNKNDDFTQILFINAHLFIFPENRNIFDGFEKKYLIV